MYKNAIKLTYPRTRFFAYKIGHGWTELVCDEKLGNKMLHVGQDRIFRIIGGTIHVVA